MYCRHCSVYLCIMHVYVHCEYFVCVLWRISAVFIGQATVNMTLIYGTVLSLNMDTDILLALKKEHKQKPLVLV